MRKIKYILFVVLMLISFNVKAADECESTEKARLKELAKKVEFDYDYKIVDGDAVFSINAVNLNDDLKVLIIEDYYNGKYQQFKGDEKATLNGFSSGQKVVITIKAFVPNYCSGSTLTTKTIKLPYYNEFYSEEKCKGNEDFKYCKILLDKRVSEREFNKQFDLYLKNKDKQSEVEPEKNQGNNSNTNLYIIIGGVVLAIAVIIIVIKIIIDKRRKNSL